MSAAAGPAPADVADLTWRALAAHEAAQAHALHARVAAALAPGTVRPDSLAHFEAHIARRGRILGAFANGELVAYGVLGLDPGGVAHMGALIGARQGELARLCLFDGAAALPRWRGQHLHRAVIAARAALAATLGRTLLLATVAPNNLPSLRGLLGEGFAIRGCALVYGGLERLLVLRDLERAAPAWRAMRRVRADDYGAHRAALADGLFGFGYAEDEAGGGCVVYGRIDATGHERQKS